MTFGIPSVAIPVDNGGEINLENHEKWLIAREHLEEMSSNTSGIDKFPRTFIPGPLDVLLGRDKIAQEHLGNYRYLQIIEDHQERYDNAPTKHQKSLLVVEILNMIQKSGGRFLKLEDCGWVEAEDSLSRSKIANAFRSRRRAVKRINKGRRIIKRQISSSEYSGCEDSNVAESGEDTNHFDCESSATMVHSSDDFMIDLPISVFSNVVEDVTEKRPRLFHHQQS